MEKIICLAGIANGIPADDFRKQQMPELAAKLAARRDVHGITVHIDDSDVADAAALRMQSAPTLPQLAVSLWLDSANQYPEIQALLAHYASDIEAYLVSESVVLDPDNPIGERGRGSTQLCRFSALPELSQQEFIQRWRGDHTAVAVATQSTFGYRQNLVVAALGDNTTRCSAIVEEHFPAEAMSSPEVFFDAVGDSDKLQQHQQQMAESCARFIDFASIDVVHMSEYVFQQPEY